MKTKKSPSTPRDAAPEEVLSPKGRKIAIALRRRGRISKARIEAITRARGIATANRERMKSAMSTEFLLAATRTTLREIADEHKALIRQAKIVAPAPLEINALGDALVSAIDDKVYTAGAERIVIGIMNRLGIKSARISEVW